MMQVFDSDLEQGVLSCVLLSQSYMARMIDVGLRPKHFYDDKHKRCFEAMVSLFDESQTIDALTVASKSGLDRDFVAYLSAAAPGASGAVTYAKEVISLWERRRLIGAGNILVDAGTTGDIALREKAEEMLSSYGGAESRTFSPEQLANRFWDRLERGKSKAWSFPSRRMTELVGGMRPGEVSLIGGWTSHGKSVFLDDVLSHVSKQATAHLFINEMTADERMDRLVSKKTGIPALKVARKEELSSGELEAVVNAITEIPYGITESSGWSVQDLRREMRRRSYDVVGIDILHLIEYREERDLAAISRTLNIAAKESGCHVLATVHLKDERLKSAVPPAPTLSDIKGAGALKQDADNVIFVYRECDDIGSPGEDAKIWFAKARQGQTGGIRAVFDGKRMTFREKGWEGF
jgi:replicative DNA helicase